jgi:hypothetical protein
LDAALEVLQRQLIDAIAYDEMDDIDFEWQRSESRQGFLKDCLSWLDDYEAHGILATLYEPRLKIEARREQVQRQIDALQLAFVGVEKKAE